MTDVQPGSANSALWLPRRALRFHRGGLHAGGYTVHTRRTPFTQTRQPSVSPKCDTRFDTCSRSGVSSADSYRSAEPTQVTAPVLSLLGRPGSWWIHRERHAFGPRSMRTPSGRSCQILPCDYPVASFQRRDYRLRRPPCLPVRSAPVAVDTGAFAWFRSYSLYHFSAQQLADWIARHSPTRFLGGDPR